jgi:hypothetical protein
MWRKPEIDRAPKGQFGFGILEWAVGGSYKSAAAGRDCARVCKLKSRLQSHSSTYNQIIQEVYEAIDPIDLVYGQTADINRRQLEQIDKARSREPCAVPPSFVATERRGLVLAILWMQRRDERETYVLKGNAVGVGASCRGERFPARRVFVVRSKNTSSGVK